MGKRHDAPRAIDSNALRQFLCEPAINRGLQYHAESLKLTASARGSQNRQLDVPREMTAKRPQADSNAGDGGKTLRHLHESTVLGNSSELLHSKST